MRFEEVMKGLVEGKKFRRKSWVHGVYVRFYRRRLRMFSEAHDAVNDYHVVPEDFTENDWEIVTEHFAFSKAFRLMNDGCTVKRGDFILVEDIYTQHLQMHRQSDGKRRAITADDINSQQWELVDQR
ncbi:MAG: hypothetical protein MJH10_09275 [Epibacterium sp.]|nr:hypothetical protein [Epibacterium sp.]NQX73726.1 hypothetical protein [Epibacterium sp.]